MEKKKLNTISLDGETVSFEDGETIYEVAKRNLKDIPTLCYDPRLDALREDADFVWLKLKGRAIPLHHVQRRRHLAWLSDRRRRKSRNTEKHCSKWLSRKTPRRRSIHFAATLLKNSRRLPIATRQGMAVSEGKQSGKSNLDDTNPFILRDYDLCISCYRCVRVCAEQEGDYAISIMNRGFHTQITTEFNGILKGVRVYLLWTVCSDLPNRRAWRQEGDACG